MYEILSAVGAGGMGEVYRARDSKLKREVALKVLPADVAADAERLARFQREAEVLASLNHPHIAQIYGLEENALVMELVEGEDLSQRIARGAIPIDEALPIATQIAEALAAAHEQGIIHRDLKPANIKVRDDGTVKVLDFGLAKALDQGSGIGDQGSGHPANSPTITSPAMTMRGVILGTAAYMSPEQAKGRPVDKRADIWAFGAVLYEMLTGRRAFDGDDMTDVLGAVVRLEPQWNALPPDIPPAIRALLRGCLTKDRGRRVADISTALFVLGSSGDLARPETTAPTAVRGPLWRRVLVPAVVAIAVAVVAVPATWLATRPGETTPARISRFQLPSAGASALSINGNDRDIAIAPDGSKIVYVGNSGTQLFVRGLDALEPAAIYTGAPRSPFVSPDGAWVGFVDANRTVKKVAITGGPATTLGAIQGTSPRGATWGQDDSIIAAADGRGAGLLRIPPGGGPSAVITRPDTSKDEGDHLWPEWLPLGRGVLFTISSLTGGLDAAAVALLDPDSGAYRVLIRGGSHAHYVPTQADAGYLIYSAGGALRAIAFDLARLETSGASIPVVSDVRTSGFGGLDAVVAGDGTLAYVPSDGRGAARTQFTLVWVDRQNRETPIGAPERFYQIPRVSPDGTRIAVIANDQNADLWVWDVVRSTFTRITVDPAYENYPVWTPDGRRLIFSSDRAGERNLFWQAADGTGQAEHLLAAPEIANAASTTPDGRVLLFTQLTAGTLGDLMQVPLQGSRVATPLVQTRFAERNPSVSPDGRWLLYEADDSGRFEIYVRPYPSVNSGRWQVSTTGGTRPMWGPDGRELFYVLPTGELMRVGVQPSASWSASPPEVLIKAGYVSNLMGQYGRSYDISPDGKRFVMIKRRGSAEADSEASITVVLNWIEELKRLLPLH